MICKENFLYQLGTFFSSHFSDYRCSTGDLWIVNLFLLFSWHPGVTNQCTLPNFGVKDLEVRLLVPSRKNSTGASPFWGEKYKDKIKPRHCIIC